MCASKHSKPLAKDVFLEKTKNFQKCAKKSNKLTALCLRSEFCIEKILEAKFRIGPNRNLGFSLLFCILGHFCSKIMASSVIDQNFAKKTCHTLSCNASRVACSAPCLQIFHPALLATVFSDLLRFFYIFLWPSFGF